MIPNKKAARIAGLLFLLMVLSGLFAELFFRQKIFSNDAAETSARILANPLLYRTGILSDIVMSLSYLLTAMALYRLLSTVDEGQAKAMVLFAAAGSIILMVNVLNEYMPLIYTSTQTGIFSAAQIGELSQFSFAAYNNGYMVGQVFFALWVLPLGILICRSGFMPKVFGILFLVEAVCGLLSVAAHFLFGNATMTNLLLLPGTVAEFAFLGFLLVRGINTKKLVKAET